VIPGTHVRALMVGMVVQLIARIENVLMVQHGLISRTQQILPIKRSNAPMRVCVIEAQEYAGVLMVTLGMRAKELFVPTTVHLMEHV